MPNSPRLWRKIRTRISLGPFGLQLTPYVALLQSQGYSPGIVRAHIRGVDLFGDWLQRQGLSAARIDEPTLGRFAARFLRLRSPSRPEGRSSEVVGRVRHFVRFLRDRGDVLPEPAPKVSAKDRCLQSFAEYLDSARGLSSGTQWRYLRYASAFIDETFGDAAPDWSRVSADDIAEFVRQQAARLAPSGCRGPVTAIRALVRHLALTGAIGRDLTGAVPPVRQWKHAALPGHLSPSQVEAVLRCCGGETAVRRRDRAILLLLARLGLRASEVAALRVDDIDWRGGSLKVRAGKSGRPRRLPLPDDVAVALVSCLKGDRPGGEQGTVFLRALPPAGPVSGAAVGRIAARALRRAGIVTARAGAHVFRHTAATSMVRGGASFKEVADVLGHARLETTAIYAKLDLAALGGVALPWPGGA